MKNIVLIGVVLLLTLKFNFSRNTPVTINSLTTTDTVVNKKTTRGNISKPTRINKSINRAKNNNKIKHASHKGKSITKNNRKTNIKSANKANLKNQANIKLHKTMSAEGMFVEKGAVKFGFDKNTLNSNKTFNQILHIADKLIFDATLQVSIAGFTDSIGTAAYNDALSLKRAQLVKAYLVDLGVNEAQIHLSFNGMADPVADNNTDGGRAENRRVEFALFIAE